jgi:HAD superfamily hydrolase (TIGR01459 family)
MPFITDVKTLFPDYGVILCDVWGVLHNGLVAFPQAAAALTAYRHQGGVVILLSNAPRPGASVVEQLDKLGVSRSSYDGIVTSGDLTRHLIAARANERFYHIGPERDLPLFAGLGKSVVDVNAADYVICTGLKDDEIETVSDYHAVLDVMRQKDIPLICANPDLVVERGSMLIPCAGAIAQAYEQRGGDVIYAGKPYPAIYDLATQNAATSHQGALEKGSILAIGDAIRTDIMGADRYGIASLFIVRGIHGHEIGPQADQPKLEAWLARQTAQPTFVMDELR